jgi:hypothetical protein
MLSGFLVLALTITQLIVAQGLQSYTRPHSYPSTGLVGQTLRRTKEEPSSNTSPKAQSPKEEILTNDSIIQLLKAGLDEDLIISKIQKTKHNFDLSTGGMVALNQAGASSRLIQFMMDPSKSVAPKTGTETAEPQPPSKPIPNTASAAATTGPTSTETNAAKSVTAPLSNTAIVPEKASSFDEFKRLIKERYGDQSLVLMVNGIYAGETGKGFLSGAGDTKLQYLHYHPSVTIPKKKRSSPIDIFGKKTNEMDQVDERTFGILESTQAVPLQRGDRLKVDRIEFLSDHIEFNLISTGFRSISQIDINKSSKESRTTTSGSEATQRVKIPNLGFRFKFFFDKEILKGSEYRTVVSEISKYLLPQQEAKHMLEAEKNVQIDQGMSEDEVVKRLGQPLRAVSFGETKTLIYGDVKVVLKNGKVVEVKID